MEPLSRREIQLPGPDSCCLGLITERLWGLTECDQQLGPENCFTAFVIVGCHAEIAGQAWESVHKLESHNLSYGT